MDFQHEIVQLIERERIRAVMQTYARGVDRREWNMVADSYHADGFDDHGGYKGDIPGLIQWLKHRHESIEQSLHFLGNCVIDFTSKDTAIVETYCVVYQRYGEEARETISLWLGDEEVPKNGRVSVEVVCRYVDSFERRDTKWRIAHRTVIMEEVKAGIQPQRLQSGWVISRRDHTDKLWAKLGIW